MSSRRSKHQASSRIGKRISKAPSRPGFTRLSREDFLLKLKQASSRNEGRAGKAPMRPQFTRFSREAFLLQLKRAKKGQNTEARRKKSKEKNAKETIQGEKERKSEEVERILQSDNAQAWEARFRMLNHDQVIQAYLNSSNEERLMSLKAMNWLWNLKTECDKEQESVWTESTYLFWKRCEEGLLKTLDLKESVAYHFLDKTDQLKVLTDLICQILQDGPASWPGVGVDLIKLLEKEILRGGLQTVMDLVKSGQERNGHDESVGELGKLSDSSRIGNIGEIDNLSDELDLSRGEETLDDLIKHFRIDSSDSGSIDESSVDSNPWTKGTPVFIRKLIMSRTGGSPVTH